MKKVTFLLSGSDKILMPTNPIIFRKSHYNLVSFHKLQASLLSNFSDGRVFEGDDAQFLFSSLKKEPCEQYPLKGRVDSLPLALYAACTHVGNRMIVEWRTDVRSPSNNFRALSALSFLRSVCAERAKYKCGIYPAIFT